MVVSCPHFFCHVGATSVTCDLQEEHLSGFAACLPSWTPESSTEFSFVPVRELAKKKHVYIWECCACGQPGINIMTNACPSCNTVRCAYCQTTKVQVR
ncbi:hypothetical protein K432DRAFT_385736 [Lepidopterella palustris CBS 459.81]|uniref:Uncharacterized protein n=1 Tax=Lepidopterella palustris CBS 459.81 TaxID=1314670 RepID=A0A8E2E2B4_9PEZI|nr:hypothetical protein K432DRAFT_385736 [Lepidopterella palustris CBS 459.81]